MSENTVTQSNMQKYHENLIVITFKFLNHARRQYMAWLFAGICMFLFQQNYQLGFNRTESLPYSFFVIHKNEPAAVGDLVAFKWDGGGKYAWMSPFPEGSIMVKQIIGGPGDTVGLDADGIIRVGSRWHAKPKATTKAGKPLVPLIKGEQTMLIGENKYYVGTEHIDGFDSRYDMVGLIHKERFMGKVYAIF